LKGRVAVGQHLDLVLVTDNIGGAHVAYDDHLRIVTGLIALVDV